MWAEDICAACRQNLEDILNIGRLLIAAKNALQHGEFEKMIVGDLPFDASTAKRLMKIARDPRMTNPAHVQDLPAAWGTLYELTMLPDIEFDCAVNSKVIKPAMTRAEARSLRSRSIKSRPVSRPSRVRDCNPVASPGHQAPDDHGDDNEILTLRRNAIDISFPDILQIEQMVGSLVMAFERGEIAVDAVVEGRIRVISDRLLSLIERQPGSLAIN